MTALFSRARRADRHPAHRPDAADRVPVRQVEVREQRARQAGERAADEQLARAMAAAVAEQARCDMTAEDALVLCELTLAVRRVAAANGIYVPEPALDGIVATCEDLATRNVRRGYSALVPIGPVASNLFDTFSPTGSDFGFPRESNTYFKALAAALPADHATRLHALQNGDDTVARARLAQLRDAGIRYCS